MGRQAGAGTIRVLPPAWIRIGFLHTVFDDAIAAHISWLVRFESVMLGSSCEQFDARQISDDAICEFARWMFANPALFPDAERCEQVKNLHRSFHREASAIVPLLVLPAPRETLEAHWRSLCALSDQLVEAVRQELQHSGQPTYRRS